MKNRRLKAWVLPCVYAVVVTATIGTITFRGINLIEEKEDYEIYTTDTNYVIDVIEPDNIPVVSEVKNKVSMPYTNEDVSMMTDYYSKDDEVKNQENSLIYYNDTYIQNTGIMYGSNEEFEIVSVLDGVVKSIKKDEILGDVIEITHSGDYVSYYYAVSKIEIKEGDQVKTGDVIAKSGTCNLENIDENNLLFEIYYQGKTVDPIEFYKIELN
ncbi:MAG: M23 family metallopeptidase [bacterium]